MITCSFGLLWVLPGLSLARAEDVYAAADALLYPPRQKAETEWCLSRLLDWASARLRGVAQFALRLQHAVSGYHFAMSIMNLIQFGV